MPELNDGDSKVSQTFEYKDGKIEETGDTLGATNNESHSTEKSEAANSQPDDVSKSEDTTGKAEKELHHQALDLIGTVLSEDYKGDRKQFFEDHPKLAEKADRSKKYKDDYRKLTSKPEVQEDDVIDEETLTDRVYSKVTEKTLLSSRKEQAEAFAVKEGLNKDDFESFHKAAEAMHKATGLNYAQCLDGAKTALKGKSSVKEPLKMPSGAGLAKEDNKEAEVQKIMKEHGVDKKVAEKFMKTRSTYNGELDKWTSA